MKKTTDLWVAAVCEMLLEETATVVSGFRAGQAVFVFRSAIDTIENNFHTGILRVNPFGLKKRVYDLKDRAKLFLEEE